MCRMQNEERICLVDNIENLIDASEHILKSTFKPEKKDAIQPSYLKTMSYDQHKVEEGCSNMEQKNTECSNTIAKRLNSWNIMLCIIVIRLILSQRVDACVHLFQSKGEMCTN